MPDVHVSSQRFYIPPDPQPWWLALRDKIVQARQAFARAPRGVRWLVYVLVAAVVGVGVPAGSAELAAEKANGGAISTWNPTVAWLNASDTKRPVKVYRTDANTTVTMPESDYIVDVLAAEASPDDPLSSLEATATVIRTYVERVKLGGSSAASTLARSHGADVTDNAQSDLPWWTNREQAARYGSQAATDEARLEQAVLATDGLIVTYHNKPILPFLFRLSPGHTRDVRYVLGRSIPYLTSTRTPADAKVAKWSRPSWYTDWTVASRLGVKPGSVHWTTLRIDAYDKAGYPISVTDGFHRWMAQTWVDDLALPSADFRLTTGNGHVIIKTIGYGNGLGLSVHEAVSLASHGTAWQQIVTRFFPGTAVQRVG